MVRITYALPAYYNFPIGGYNVHYTYAGLLQQLGHAVTLVFPRSPDARATLLGRARGAVWAMRTRARNRPLIGSFPLHPGIRVSLTPDLSPGSLPDADVLIATGWGTAEALADAPPSKGARAYVVFDYEYYMTAPAETQERMRATYRADYTMIATSTAVAEMIHAAGRVPTAIIPSGIDLIAFGQDVDATQRKPLTLGFPLRSEPFKGAADAIEAAEILRSIYGDRLTVTAFGSHDVPLPQSITRLRSPTQQQLRNFYNEQSVFMLPSRYEGWGLTGVEAMACGAALVVTANGGARDYAIDGETALVVPPGDAAGLAAAAGRLFEDDTLRLRLSRTGRDYVQRFDWQQAGTRLEAVLASAAVR